MDLIDSFSTTMQAIIVVLVFSGLTVAGLYFVRRHVSSRQLKEDHDVAGFTFSVVGAFYGMILAFVIVAVWQRFERANEQAQDESLALSNLYNLSGGFDQPEAMTCKRRFTPMQLRLSITNSRKWPNTNIR
jgi:hypothetical protein